MPARKRSTKPIPIRRPRAKKEKDAKPAREPAEFSIADDPKAVADQMISAGKLEALSHLRHASVAYVFTTAERVGRDGMAAASRYQRKFHPLSRGKYDFLIVFSQPIWRRLTEKQRKAVVYHELLHCGSDENGHFRLEPHDVEEFALVIKHFGIWNERARVMKLQMDLWDLPVGGAAGAITPEPISQAASKDDGKEEK